MLISLKLCEVDDCRYGEYNDQLGLAVSILKYFNWNAFK